MARLWSRFWHCWLTDLEIQALPWELKGRWAQLFLMVGQYGQGGDLYLPKGLRSLPPEWTRGVTTRGLRHLLLRLPGVTLMEDEPPAQGVHIVFANWRKYQEWSPSKLNRTRVPRPYTSSAAKSPPSPPTDTEVNPDPPTPFRSRRRAGPRSVASTLAADPPPRDPAVIPPAEVTALEQAIAYDHPAWSARQVEDEARRRLTSPDESHVNGQPDTPEASPHSPPALRFRDA